MRQMTARFQSTGSCGHIILPGDEIGYDSKSKRTRCARCWENVKSRATREAQEKMERQYR